MACPPACPLEKNGIKKLEKYKKTPASKQGVE